MGPAALAFLVAGGVSTGTFRRDEVECEETVAWLNDCCESFDPTAIRCWYHDGGCQGEDTLPSLSPEESECIRARSCAELREAQVCERVLERNQNLDEAGNPTSFDPVCP